MRVWIVCLGMLVALSISSVSFACHGRKCGCRDRGHKSLFSWHGARQCSHCDHAPVVLGGPETACGRACGACDRQCGPRCAKGCASRCGSCRPRCSHFGCIGRFVGWLGKCGKCSGCGPKYRPGWKSRPCEPCNRCGDWTGPSIHHGRRYIGPPRSGSNFGGQIEIVPGTPSEAAPEAPEKPADPIDDASEEPEAKETGLPGLSIKRASHYAPYSSQQMPRHRRAASSTIRTNKPQTTRAVPQRAVRVIRVQMDPTRSSAKPTRIVIE